jgi:hypothetical protein
LKAEDLAIAVSQGSHFDRQLHHKFRLLPGIQLFNTYRCTWGMWVDLTKKSNRGEVKIANGSIAGIVHHDRNLRACVGGTGW